MPSFFTLLKQEFIALLKFPSTKDSNEIRFQKRVVRFPAPTVERKRPTKIQNGSSVPTTTKSLTIPGKEKEGNSSTAIRPRSYSSPSSNVKIRQKRISRRSESSYPSNGLSPKGFARKAANVNVTRNRSSTIVQIEV